MQIYATCVLTNAEKWPICNNSLILNGGGVQDAHPLIQFEFAGTKKYKAVSNIFMGYIFCHVIHRLYVLQK